MRDLMRQREMTGRCVARLVPCGPALVSRLASGRKQPLARMARRSLYPTRGRGWTQVEMHRAEALIRSGDVNGGAQHCVTVLTALPGAWRRDGMITASARAALAAVPPAQSARRSVREAHDVLALPAGQS